MDAATFTATSDGYIAACEAAEAVASPDERAEVEAAALRAGTEALRLVARLRAVADGDCEPPDLDGLCMACGRKIAEPVPAAKHGCDPFAIVVWPAARLRRLAIRITRLGRLFWAAARNRGAA